MKDAAPPLFERVLRKLRSVVMYGELNNYLAEMNADSPLKGIKARVVGDASADPSEFFNHYDAFAFWVAESLAKESRNRKILDVGSPKMMSAMLSASYEVTSLVLADCQDELSSVNYIVHDISDPIPCGSETVDCLTSTVALPLAGLGRYGDKVDPNCLEKFLSEVDRVMMKDSDLFVSMCLGPNLLAFNNGWFFDMDTILKIFKGWELKENVVDSGSSPKNTGNSKPGDRFSPYTGKENIEYGDYRVIFCHFRRQKLCPGSSGK